LPGNQNKNRNRLRQAETGAWVDGNKHGLLVKRVPVESVGHGNPSALMPLCWRRGQGFVAIATRPGAACGAGSSQQLVLQCLRTTAPATATTSTSAPPTSPGPP
jgi:hypothetical protein